jgi:short chain dehydrogenase
MRFKDKVAAVTGGGSGIGKEVAKRFVAEGGKVFINGREERKLKTAAVEIDPTAEKVGIYAGDIAQPAVGRELIEATIKRFGAIDVLINNAGVFRPKPFLELEETDYDWFLDTILKGKFFTAQAAAKAMKAQGRGGSDRPYGFSVGYSGYWCHSFVSWRFVERSDVPTGPWSLYGIVESSPPLKNRRSTQLPYKSYNVLFAKVIHEGSLSRRYPASRFVELRFIEVANRRSRERSAESRQPLLPFLFADDSHPLDLVEMLGVPLDVLPQCTSVPSVKIVHHHEDADFPILLDQPLGVRNKLFVILASQLSRHMNLQ